MITESLRKLNMYLRCLITVIAGTGGLLTR